MGRHSADHRGQLNVRVKRGHVYYWSVMRDLDKECGAFTISDVFDRTNGADKASIRDYLNRLVKAGFAIKNVAREDATGSIPFNLYILLKTPQRAPRLRRDGSVCTQGAGQRHMWTAMRQCGAFSVNNITEIASTEQVQVSTQTAKSYIQHLFRAGYLRLVSKARGSICATYRLKTSMNTGPRPPQIQRTKFVWDANLKKIMTDEAVTERRAS